MMIQSIDLNSIDSPSNLISLPDNFIDSEQLEEFNNLVEKQYINFDNLGINYVDDLPIPYKLEIYGNMLDYASENYLSIVDYDACSVAPEKLLYVGDKVYKLLCIDSFNTIAPNFLNRNDCISIEGFNLLLKVKYKNNYNLMKVSILKTIQSLIDGLLRLPEMDLKIREDNMYKNLLRKYSYYIELIDFGDAEKFINNYLNPMVIKNFESILWRIT